MEIKVCGNKYNVEQVAALPVSYMGFIFYEKSPRFFAGELPNIPASIQKVGVFVNASVVTIKEKVEKYGLEIAQLHGGEPASFCSSLKNELPDIKIWKVFSVNDDFDFSQLKDFSQADAFLFDTKGKYYGGNGVKFDWFILENYTEEKPFFLSGGVELEDVTSIKYFARKFPQLKGVDINSRFETRPGEKNIDSIKLFQQKLLA